MTSFRASFSSASRLDCRAGLFSSPRRLVKLAATLLILPPAHLYPCASDLVIVRPTNPGPGARGGGTLIFFRILFFFVEKLV
jgi:hypothetical protein